MKYPLLVLLLVLVSCQEEIELGNSDLVPKINLIEIEELKKKPTEFNNDTIRLKCAIYLTMENHSFYNKDYSIWIDSFNPATDLKTGWEKFNNKKVELIGLYQSGKTGHLGLYNGKFIEIYYIKSE